MSVDKFPIYCEAVCCGLSKVCEVGYGISAFECHLDICVSEYACDLAYLWGNVGECYPPLVFVRTCVQYGLLCILFYLMS